MRRRGFTLIELLVIIAVMAAMVTVGVVSLGSSRSSMRLFGAGRDAMAMIRRARSMALVTQKPVVIVYENKTVEDEPCASITIKADDLFVAKKSTETVYTLSGEIVREGVDESEDAGGESLRDVLSPDSMPSDVVKGLKIKVEDESDASLLAESESYSSKISIFSTADNVSRTLSAAQPTKNEENKEAETSESENEVFSVAFAANGTVTPPHRIRIYAAGGRPEDGIVIHVDRFGEPKCEDFD